MNYSRPLDFGRQQTTIQAAPAVATDAVFTTSAQYLHQIVAIRFTLVTDANVANRLITITLDDAGTVLWQVAANAAQTAGQTIIYNASPNLPGTGIATRLSHIPIPHPDAFAGVMNIRTSTTNLQAGDQYTGIQLTEKIWIP